MGHDGCAGRLDLCSDLAPRLTTATGMRQARGRRSEAPKRFAALARAFAASASRSRGGASVTRELRKLARRLLDLLHRPAECQLVCFGWARETTQLADE